MPSDRKIFMSATRMSMYLQCKWKYWCNYILHLPRKENVSFKLGIAVHEALAKAGEIWMETESFTAKDVRQIGEVYNKIASREGIDDPAVFHEGIQMVNSRLQDFESGKIISIEDRFKVETNEGIMLTGAMDKVIELNEDTIVVIDYKTSKYFYNRSELKSDLQLSMYDLVASLKFPDYDRIILSLDYLRGSPVYTYRTVEERRSFNKYLQSVYMQMGKLTEDRAVPRLNDMCNWCDFSDECPAYNNVISDNVKLKKRLDTYDDKQLVSEYLNVKSRKRILDGQEKKLKQFIISKIKDEEQDLMGEEKILYIRQNTSTVYDPKTVYENIPVNKFLEMVSVSKRAADMYLETNPSVKSKIESTSRLSYTSPFLSYKTLNNLRNKED